ncbi:unnamed protein product [Lupinus luteus]|uniref:Uncharacterized protein n=1 Tax=Lupinus luteus TaxID=3873 RepID=A0AAV1WF33_LUPLU
MIFLSKGMIFLSKSLNIHLFFPLSFSQHFVFYFVKNLPFSTFSGFPLTFVDFFEKKMQHLLFFWVFRYTWVSEFLVKQTIKLEYILCQPVKSSFYLYLPLLLIFERVSLMSLLFIDFLCFSHSKSIS